MDFGISIGVSKEYVGGLVGEGISCVWGIEIVESLDDVLDEVFLFEMGRGNRGQGGEEEGFGLYGER